MDEEDIQLAIALSLSELDTSHAIQPDSTSVELKSNKCEKNDSKTYSSHFEKLGTFSETFSQGDKSCITKEDEQIQLALAISLSAAESTNSSTEASVAKNLCKTGAELDAKSQESSSALQEAWDISKKNKSKRQAISVDKNEVIVVSRSKIDDYLNDVDNIEDDEELHLALALSASEADNHDAFSIEKNAEDTPDTNKLSSGSSCADSVFTVNSRTGNSNFINNFTTKKNCLGKVSSSYCEPKVSDGNGETVKIENHVSDDLSDSHDSFEISDLSFTEDINSDATSDESPPLDSRSRKKRKRREFEVVSKKKKKIERTELVRKSICVNRSKANQLRDQVLAVEDPYLWKLIHLDSKRQKPPVLSKIQLESLRECRRMLFSALVGVDEALTTDPDDCLSFTGNRLKTVLQALSITASADEIESMMLLWQPLGCDHQKNDLKRLCEICWKTKVLKERNFDTTSKEIDLDRLSCNWTHFAYIFDQCNLKVEKSGKVW